MRSFRLARVAAQAEFLRLRYLLRRQAVRGVLAVVAAVFLLAALVGVHVAGALALAERVSPVQAVLIVAGVDVAIAIVFAVLAARNVPSDVEREALRLRQTAMDQVVETVVLATLVARLRYVRSLRDFCDVVAAALVAWLVGVRR